jgi:hypothetical protein
MPVVEAEVRRSDVQTFRRSTTTTYVVRGLRHDKLAWRGNVADLVVVALVTDILHYDLTVRRLHLSYSREGIPGYCQTGVAIILVDALMLSLLRTNKFYLHSPMNNL